jgi:hypothetical protein
VFLEMFLVTFKTEKKRFAGDISTLVRVQLPPAALSISPRMKHSLRSTLIQFFEDFCAFRFSNQTKMRKRGKIARETSPLAVCSAEQLDVVFFAVKQKFN